MTDLRTHFMGPMKHHGLDCNEGALYNGGKCTCYSSCGAKEKLGANSKRPQDTCTCDVYKPHAVHRCGQCGSRWSDDEPTEGGK